MLDFITRLVVGFLMWIEHKLEKGKKAIDAPKDPDLLRRAGDRVRERLRAEDDPRS